MTVLKFPDPKREPTDSYPMYCASCGEERTIPNSAAITPCKCGSTVRVSSFLRGTVGSSGFTPK